VIGFLPPSEKQFFIFAKSRKSGGNRILQRSDTHWTVINLPNQSVSVFEQDFYGI
jgi:hypothetical protein